MSGTAIVRLSPIAPIARENLPAVRRRDLAALQERRRVERGRLVSCSALGSVTSLFTLAYGVGSWFAWYAGSMGFGVFLTVICAGLLLATSCLLRDGRAHLEAFRSLAPPPELLKDAEAERVLAEAVDAFRVQADDWNAALAATDSNDVGPPFMGLLVDARERLEERRSALVEGVARAWDAATASVAPKALPPPRDWGITETVVIGS